MAKINILDSTVYNRIAAGEVVERPFSVVKELVENSIDAGADKITVEIIGGGIMSIKVTDNGGGIEKSELRSALLPHATSKISEVSDLDCIITLGFRGEALASIASVSKIKISTKPNSQEFGASISAEGGVLSDVIDSASAGGTEITVSDLFYNTPVRRKFLKSPKSEETDISNIITRFILGNPQISFKYIADGKTVYQSYGDGLESAMLCVYGGNVINDCFYIDNERNGIRISGYLGKHHFTKSNRTYQSLFINGRYVINSTVSAAISNAYASYLMKRQYPFYVLKVEMPADIVDVNVHPNKTDVRFSNNQVVYSAINLTVSRVLDGTSEAVNIVKSAGNSFGDIVASEIQIPKEISNKITSDYDRHNDYKTQDIANKKYDTTPLPKMYLSLRDSGANTPEIGKIEETIYNKENVETDIFQENKKYIEELYAKRQTEQQTIDAERPLVAVGQVLNTYLILEDGKDIYFVDQHAAHERVLFDKFYGKAQDKQLAIQPMLAPYVFKVNNFESAFLSSRLEYFGELGFDLTEFGYNTFKVSALPIELSEMNVKDFFDDVFSDMNYFKNEKMPNIIKEKLASKACKAAIKSGDKLSDSEIDALLMLLKGNMGLKCPHGRPIAIKITRTEIDKWFKRIV